jgi:glycosyltransferase involved in cell wall biosynthesis
MHCSILWHVFQSEKGAFMDGQLMRTIGTPQSDGREFAPARIVKIELSQPIPGIAAFDIQREQLYKRAIAYVYMHTQPLGAVEFTFNEQGISEQVCAERIWQSLAVQINEHLRDDGLPYVASLALEGIPASQQPGCEIERERFLEHAPFVSIVVPTHDRPDDLRFCLPTLLAQRYPNYEIIIVDNTPSTSETRDLILQEYGGYEHVYYVCEDRPGASWARNAGIEAARGEILAFTDDDVEADPNWLLELVKGFGSAENVGCVTGQVQPIELETPAQYWCEENAGLRWFQEANVPAKRFVRHVFQRSRRHVHLYRVGLFGCGANMAFRADVLRQIHYFDPALGGSGPSHCGQDIAAFFQTLIQGYTVVYEPASLVYHLHRRSYSALRKQFYNYGIGMTAYLSKNVYEHPQLLIDLLTRVPYDLFVARPDVINRKTSHYPTDLKCVNWKGMLYGPLAYIQSRREAQRNGWSYPTWREHFSLKMKALFMSVPPA